jgi:thiol-disulfide isomerase/thioredoxin
MKSLFIGLCFAVAAMYMPSKLHAQPLKVGDLIPDQTFVGVLNYVDTSLNLSKFRGRLVILDFWNHTCKGCIASFPKLDQLQKRFGDSIQIVLVNPESREATKKLFAKFKSIFIPDLPMITGDRILTNYFPTTHNPYHVWIDQKGVIRSLTYTHNATEKNIRKFLDGERNFILNKRPVTDPISYSLLKTGNVNWESEYVYSSLISYCSGRTGGSNGTDSIANGESIRLHVNCKSIYELYTFAYNENGKIEREIILITGDSSRYLRPKDPSELDKWMLKNSYNYDLILPAEKKALRYKVMQDELGQYFKIKVTIGKKKKPAFVLVRTGELNALATKGGKFRNDLGVSKERLDTLDTLYRFQNAPFSNLSFALKTRLYTAPGTFFDETGYTGNIDINIPRHLYKPFDLEGIRRLLRVYNLDIIRAEREVEVVILEEE